MVLLETIIEDLNLLPVWLVKIIMKYEVLYLISN